MTAGELTRWEWRQPFGDVTVVLLVDGERREARVMTGPGMSSPTISHAGLAWELAGLFAAVTDWLAGDPPPAPERLDQPSLFDTKESA